MALNITFQGSIYSYNSGTKFTADQVRYQVFFCKVSSGSSASKWNNVKYSELGDYSFNLGDGDFLGQSGVANTGDKVLVLFWTPNTLTRSSTGLTEWAMIELSLTGANTYVTNVQLRSSFTPNIQYVLSGSDYVKETVVMTDTGSNDNHYWTYSGNTMSHQYSKYGQTLFDINGLPSSCVTINWDIDSTTSIDTNLNSGSPQYHTYSFAKIYTIHLTLTNKSGMTSSCDYTKKIYWHVPDVNFTISNTNPYPILDMGFGEEITFTNTSADPDGRCNIDGWNYDWTISDNGDYVDRSDSLAAVLNTINPTHSFHNPGTHDITLNCNYYDGYTWKKKNVTKSLIQNVWISQCGLSWTVPVIFAMEVTFTPHITGTSGHTRKVDYILDETNQIFSNYGDDVNFTYTFLESNNHYLKQVVHYNDGFKDVKTESTFIIQMMPLAEFENSKFECGVKFSDISIPGKPPIVHQKWTVRCNGKIEAINNDVEDFYYSWPYPGTYTVELEVTDSNNNVDEVVHVFSDMTCAGGNVTPQFMAPPPPPPSVLQNSAIPSILVTNIEWEDEQKKPIILIIKSANEEILDEQNIDYEVPDM